MDLPALQAGAQRVEVGTLAWFRVTTLEADLSAHLEEEWLPGLPAEVTLGASAGA